MTVEYGQILTEWMYKTFIFMKEADEYFYVYKEEYNDEVAFQEILKLAAILEPTPEQVERLELLNIQRSMNDVFHWYGVTAQATSISVLKIHAKTLKDSVERWNIEKLEQQVSSEALSVVSMAVHEARRRQLDTLRAIEDYANSLLQGVEHLESLLIAYTNNLTNPQQIRAIQKVQRIDELAKAVGWEKITDRVVKEITESIEQRLPYFIEKGKAKPKPTLIRNVYLASYFVSKASSNDQELIPQAIQAGVSEDELLMELLTRDYHDEQTKKVNARQSILDQIRGVTQQQPTDEPKQTPSHKPIAPLDEVLKKLDQRLFGDE